MQVAEPSVTECADTISIAFPITVWALWHRLQAETPVAVTWAQFGLLSLFTVTV
jgi:hypothetical protein